METESTTAFELMYIKFVFFYYNTNAIVFPNCFRWRAAFLVTISYYPTGKRIYVSMCYAIDPLERGRCTNVRQST